MRYFVFIVFSALLNVVVFAQGVTAFHDIQPTGENNTYTIKTTVSGLQGVDIARITYFIDNTHTYNASPNNAFFSDRNDKFIKFYIMAVPSSGEISVELGVTLVGSGEFAFPVEFQYSKNEEKKSINLPQIIIAGQALAVVEDLPTEDEPDVEPVKVEEEIVEEVETEESLEDKIKAEEQEQLAKEQTEAEQKVKEEQEAAKKAEEERVAREQEEAEAKAEEEKRLAEEKAKQKEEKKKQEEARKLAAEQKAKEEAEALAKAEEAKRIAEEKAAREAEEVAVVESQEEIEEENHEETNTQPEVIETPPASSKVSARYSIQILSLSKFSQSRLDNYVRQHNLDKTKVVKRVVGEWTKISYGKLDSKDEAREMIQRLRRNHNITDCFLITLP